MRFLVLVILTLLWLYLHGLRTAEGARAPGTEGPRFDTREVVAGYCMIQVRPEDAAVDSVRPVR